MPYIVVMLLALILSGPADAQVRVDIGIHLPAPPKLVIVPGHATVHYAPAPAAPANLFFYGDQYWIFSNGGWHVSRQHGGPWIVVAPQFVPRPLLAVPVRYYHVPPGHWKQWNHQASPRWEHEWGQEWAHKRQWRGRDDDRGGHRGQRAERRGDRGDDRGKDRGKGHGKGQGKGHDRDR